MTKLLTLKEISKVLGVPESSLRKYREIFSPFIPSVGTGRSRRYRAEAIEIFQDIRKLREETHMPWDAISDSLAEKYPIDATPEPQQQEPQFPQPAPPAPKMIRPATPLQPTTPQPQAMEPAPAAGSTYLKKIAAISEKQMMIVNAMALELMQSVEKTRIQARSETERMHAHLARTINAMSRSMSEVSREEKKLMADIQNRLTEVRQSVARVEKSGDRVVRLVEVETQLKTVQRKLQQREKLIQEYKNSFEVLKRENTELRAFKGRHIDSAQERVREVKGLRKTPFIKKIFGPKI